MPEAIKSFEDLEVWQRGIDLTIRGYALIGTLPASEKYELATQMKRSVVSIPANIAEGHARRLPRPFLNHVNIALGSLAEWITYLVIAERQGFITPAMLARERLEADRIGQMLSALARWLRRRIQQLHAGERRASSADPSALA